MKTLLTMVLTTLCLCAAAQTVRVIDEVEYEPIPDVVISDAEHTKSVKTDLLGEADLSAFSPKDSLVFEHENYHTKTMSFKNLKKDGMKVFMIDVSFLAPIEVPVEVKRDPPKTSTNSQIRLLSESDIRKINAQTSADMLQATGAVMVQKSQAGGGSPVIRGFEANRILLVVDGVRMNNAIYRSGHLQNAITVDNNMLSSTNIYFGPGSVIYGSDALGGVVHFHTKTPLLKDEKKFDGFGGSGMIRYTSVNNEKSGHFDFNVATKNWAYLASVTATEFGDLRMGSVRAHGYEDWGKFNYYVQRIDGADSAILNPDPNLQVGTGYKQYDLMQKIRYKASSDLNFILNTQYSTSSNVARFDRLNDLGDDGLPKFAEWYYGPQKRFLTSLKTEITNKGGAFSRASIIAAYQNIDEDRINRRFQSDWENRRFEDVDVFSLNADFTKQFDTIHSISYGIEGTHNIVASSAHSQNIETGELTDNSTRYPDGGSTMSTLASYIAYDRKLSRYSILNTGIRYSRAILQSRFEDTSFVELPFNEINFNGGALSGSIGFTVKPDPTSNVNVILSTGFRSPNVDDYGKVFEKDGRVVVPNDQLKPENAYNGEISFSKSFRKTVKEITSTNQKAEMVRVSAGVFYTHLTNTIVRVDYQLNGQDSLLYDGELARIQTNSNAANAYIVGGTAELKLRFSPSFHFTSSATYTFGQNLSNASPLGHIPPLYGQTSINLVRKLWSVSLFSRYNGAKPAVDYSPSGEDNLQEATEDGTPAWYTLNLKGSVEAFENLQIQAAIENILDHHYKQFSSGISAPGRSFSLTLRANF